MVTKLAINQLLSQQFITNVHYRDANACSRIEVTSRADNGCCTTTFPQCTRQTRLS